MSGFTGLDWLAAERLAPRVADALRLPSAGAVPGPVPAAAVTAVANDVRLLAQAAGRQAQAAVAPGGPAATASARAISSVGVAIAELLAALPAPAGAVRGAAPLATDAAGGATALARGLALAVARSGLFYESHLAQAGAGSLPLEQLRHEPQAGWRVRAADGQEAAARASSRREDRAAEAGRAAAIVPPQARALVAQQLELLATGVFRWSGEAWPNVAMRWEVQRERAGDQDDGAGTPARRWSTTFALTLAHLGEVEVSLSLAGDRLRARVRAGAAAAGHLRAAHGELPLQLAGAGLVLPELSITAAEAS